MQSGIRKTLVALAAVVLLAVLTGGFYLWSIDRQYDKARNQADVVKSHFEFEGSGPSLDQLPQITGDLSRLEEDLRELDRRVERPLIGSLVKSAPIVGEQVRESQELLDLGIELTSISRESSEIANQMKEALETNGFMGDEPLVGPTWLDVVNEHWDKIYELEARFDAALQARAEINEENLPGRALDTLNTLDGLLERGENLRDEYFHLFPMLNAAFGADEEVRYLILLQNGQEIRPGGGFVGTYGTMTVLNGRITSLEISPIGIMNRAYEEARAEILPSPAPIATYLLQTEWFPHDANWSPDYPSVVAQLNEMYASLDWPPLAGVLAVNDSVVGDVLDIIGPYQISMDARTETVTSDNFMDLIQSLRGGDETHKAFVGVLGRSIIDQVLEADFETKKTIFWSLRDSANDREVQVAMSDPTLQEEVVRRGWDGALYPDPDLATMVFTIANITGNKASPMLSYDVYLEMKPSPVEGMLRVRWTLELKHLGDPDGSLEFNGFHRTWLQIFLPEDAAFDFSTLDPEPEDMVEDPGAMAWHIELLTATKQQLTIEYDLPDDESQLLLRRQSGLHDVRYHIDGDTGSCSPDFHGEFERDLLFDFTTCEVTEYITARQ